MLMSTCLHGDLHRAQHPTTKIRYFMLHSSAPTPAAKLKSKQKQPASEAGPKAQLLDEPNPDANATAASHQGMPLSGICDLVERACIEPMQHALSMPVADRTPSASLAALFS